VSDKGKPDDLSLAALVNAASESVRRPIAGRTPQATRRDAPASVDLNALVSQFDSGQKNTPKTAHQASPSSPRTAPPPVRSASPERETADLAQLVSNAETGGTPRAAATPKPAKPPSPTVSDAVNQFAAHGSKHVHDSQMLIKAAGAPAKFDPQDRSSKLSGAMSGRGALIAIAVVVALSVSIAYLRDRPVPAGLGTPLVQEKPLFDLTAKQSELVGHLREARAEVERYRKEHGGLPVRIEHKVAGVRFYLRPVRDSYMIIAVSDHQNLVLMGEGRWYKAR
jgi:hypothetical protein